MWWVVGGDAWVGIGLGEIELRMIGVLCALCAVVCVDCVG